MLSVPQWLDAGEPFEQGIALLERLNPGSMALIVCRGGKNSISINKLRQALLAERGREVETPVMPEEKAQDKKSKSSYYQRSDLPGILADMLDGVSPMYKEARHLRTLLFTEKAKGERRRMSLRILELMRPVRACWQAIDLWKETGELPQPKMEVKKAEPSQMGLYDMLTRLNNLQSYRSKRGNELRNLKDPAMMQRKVALIAGYDQEEKGIRERLDVIDKAVKDGII